MVQILEPRESFGEIISRGLGQGASQGLMGGLSLSQRMAEESRSAKLQRQRDQEQRQHQLGLLEREYGLKRQLASEKSQPSEYGNKIIEQLTGIDLSDVTDTDERKVIIAELLKQQGQQKNLEQKQGLLGKIFGSSQQQNETTQRNPLQNEQEPQQSNFNPLDISDEQIAEAAIIDPNLARILAQEKDVALREGREKNKLEREEFREERKYHTEFSKELEKDVNQRRELLSKKENALDYARNAIETGNLKFFSPDKLADITGLDVFRTAKGAQLITAGKENLLSNMGRVSARAQNLWFEQRLNSMFPKIGQSDEANLTVQEMLEGELAIDKAYMHAFDKLAEDDEQNLGYVRKDISKRAHNEIKPLEKQILNRTSYRMREVEEVEKGLPSLRKQVGKNVVKGTPLTMAMAKLYKEKFGDNALKVAERNGYYIPTLEEFKNFREEPREFREGLSE